jgi:hypothetical protein
MKTETQKASKRHASLKNQMDEVPKTKTVSFNFSCAVWNFQSLKMGLQFSQNVGKEFLLYTM